MGPGMAKNDEDKLRENLLAMARAFGKAKGWSLSTVSRNAHGDIPFFDRLARGSGSFTMRKYVEVMDYFDANWPEGLKRPALWEIVKL